MSFELSELKDYWCIVDLDQEEDQILILRTSDDTYEDELFDWEIKAENTALDYSWSEFDDTGFKPISGIYKLTLEPIYLNPEDDHPNDIKVTKFELLFALSGGINK